MRLRRRLEDNTKAEMNINSVKWIHLAQVCVQ
jgi:hypothetical protein